MKERFLVVNQPAAIGVSTNLFKEIAAIDPSLEKRALAFLRASMYVVNLKEEASTVLLQAARTKPPSPPAEPGIGFLKVRIANETVHEQLVMIFRETFGLSRVRADYLMRVTLAAYLIHLRSIPAAPQAESPGVDRLALNLLLARLLADPSAEETLARISEILQEQGVN